MTSEIVIDVQPKEVSIALLEDKSLVELQSEGRNILFGFVLSTMMIPWCVTIIPKYSMIQAFGWMDSYKALIIPAMFSGFGIFMMKQHISALPDEILEAARIDGANEFYIFHKIVLPMSKNGSSVLRSSSSFGHGRISCGHTW